VRHRLHNYASPKPTRARHIGDRPLPLRIWRAFQSGFLRTTTHIEDARLAPIHLLLASQRLLRCCSLAGASACSCP
jgi:hypothetical protein